MSGPEHEFVLNRAHDMGVELDDDQVCRLLDYLDLLSRWNRVYNLTAIRERQAMLTHHLLDCLSIIPFLRKNIGQQNPSLMDVGSGAGLPGLILAIIQPQWQISCADAVAKKAAFVQQVISHLKLENAQSIHARVETLTGQYDLISSRALTTLADFFKLTKHLSHADTQWLAMKGKQPDEEIRMLPDNVRVREIDKLHVPGLNADRCLVWMQIKNTS